MMKPIRYVYLLHRWLGIALCCFFAMWFFSGVVMMYVGFPSLTEDERLQGLPALQAEQVRVPVSDLLERLPEGVAIEALTLASVLNRPAYLLQGSDQAWYGMYADEGTLFSAFTAPQAAAAARLFAEQSGLASGVIRVSDRLMLDQWTVSSRLDAYRPLYRVTLDNNAGHQLYISALTGQVVRDTRQSERLWNWLGANLHWIYPVQLRQHVDLWRNLVIWLSLLGLVCLVTGAVIGFLRLRIKKNYRGGRHTPYRGVMKYHHVLGLGILLLLTTYLFSGLMSMNPWDLFSEEKPLATQLMRYRSNGQPLMPAEAAMSPVQLRQILRAHPHTREIKWHWLGGALYQTLHDDTTSLAGAFAAELETRLQAAVPALMPGSRIQSWQRLDAHDLYYYSHHGSHRPLPVLRVKFDDDEASWFYIDLTTGEVVHKLTARKRLQRWLFNALHSFDFSILLKHRPVWDVIVIALCSLGFVFSATALVIGWRRLRFRSRRKSLPRCAGSAPKAEAPGR